jgi:xylan 1,4-beta-xylosidase
MTDMSLRPSASSPGRTYRWYKDTPVYEFGFGLHYTTFNVAWHQTPPASYDISALVNSAHGQQPLDLATFDVFNIDVKNAGQTLSDYVALLFVNGTGGPAPYPNKQLVSYTRVHNIKAGSTSRVQLPVTLGSVARADANGNLWIYSGSYQVSVDTTPSLTHSFVLRGSSVQLTHWPQNTTA